MLYTSSPLAAVAGLLAAGAAALPANSNAVPVNATLGSALWINGQPAERVSDSTLAARSISGTCGKGEDVVVCAKRLAQKFSNQAVGDQEMPKRTYVWKTNPKYHNKMGWADFTLEYTPVFGSCKVSDPVIVNQGALFACNLEGGCSQSFTQSRVVTDTVNYGYKVGTKVNVGGDIKFVSVSTEVSTEWSQDWSKSIEVTTTSQRTYNLANGEVCAPTTVQIQMDCIGDLKDAKMIAHGFRAQDPHFVKDFKAWCDAAFAGPRVFDDWQKWTGQDFRVLCNQVKNSRVPRNMYLRSSATDGSSWTVEGCSLSQ